MTAMRDSTRPLASTIGLLRIPALLIALLVSQNASAAVSPPVLHDETGQKDSGFTFGVNISTNFFTVVPQLSLDLGIVQGGLFAGYKVGRFIFGLGFDIERVAKEQTIGATVSSSSTAVLFLPGVRVALLRSADLKVELFGQFDIGYGHTFSDPGPSAPATSNTSNHRLVYQVGPGLRYWLHPQFAFSATAALRGDFAFNSMSQPNQIPQSSSSGVTGIAGIMEFIGVF